MADTKVNWMGLIGLIGTILMIVCVFLSWVDIEVGVLGYTNTTSFSGWDVFSNADLNADYAYAPVVTLVAGILALITTIIPILPNLFKSDKVNKLLGALSLILAIVAVILIVLFTGQMDSIGYEGVLSAGASAGIGLWLSLVGAVILAVGGILAVVMKYAPKNKAESE